jgi:hypothetical protein
MFVVIGSCATHAQRTGDFSVVRASGLMLYGRAAPFADCSEFVPPPGTAGRCERRPRGERNSPAEYVNSPDLPATRVFGEIPQPGREARNQDFRYPDDKFGAFARRVIWNQPLDYVEAVGLGLVTWSCRLEGTRESREWAHTRAATGTCHETAATLDLDFWYDSEPVRRRGADRLASYTRSAQLEGAPTLLLALLAIAGLGFGRGPARRGAVVAGLLAAADSRRRWSRLIRTLVTRCRAGACWLLWATGPFGTRDAKGGQVSVGASRTARTAAPANASIASTPTRAMVTGVTNSGLSNESRRSSSSTSCCPKYRFNQ